MRLNPGKSRKMRELSKAVIRRKTLHLLTAIIPLSYIFLDRFIMVIFLIILGVSAVIIDFLRLECAPVKRFFYLHFGDLFWKREEHSLTGATMYAVSAFLSIYLFDKWIAIAVLLFLAFGDTAAHIIGVRWGITYLNGEKTVEGSAACLVICLVISILLPSPEILILVVGALVAALVELFPLGVDDNLTLPLISGVAMEIIMKQLTGL
ncbi:hypothetical protein KAW18_16270 [candidate division WOR-3 bacterium]|nr:hypothetical protein [candidate division WOR-3 bacterium]